jgi:hypothetical protein
VSECSLYNKLLYRVAQQSKVTAISVLWWQFFFSDLIDALAELDPLWM